jgi:hypothetical protein
MLLKHFTFIIFNSSDQLYQCSEHENFRI